MNFLISVISLNYFILKILQPNICLALNKIANLHHLIVAVIFTDSNVFASINFLNRSSYIVYTESKSTLRSKKSCL